MSHMVLVWPRGDREVIMQESKWSRPGPRGIGPSRRRSMCEKDCVRAKLERVSGLSVIVLESENGNKGSLHQKRVRQRRVWQIEEAIGRVESRVTLHLAQFLKLFRPPLCHLHRYLHVVTTDIYLHISGYSFARGILCACIPSAVYIQQHNTTLGHYLLHINHRLHTFWDLLCWPLSPLLESRWTLHVGMALMGNLCNT